MSEDVTYNADGTKHPSRLWALSENHSAASWPVARPPVFLPQRRQRHATIAATSIAAGCTAPARTRAESLGYRPDDADHAALDCCASDPDRTGDHSLARRSGCFRPRTSRTFRIDNLSAGIGPPVAQIAKGGSDCRQRSHLTLSSVVAIGRRQIGSSSAQGLMMRSSEASKSDVLRVTRVMP